MSRFEKTMLELGYALEGQDGLKLTYLKNATYSDLVLVIDLGLKYINPILVPSSLILYEKDFEMMMSEFYTLRGDAKFLAKESNGKLKVLNTGGKDL